MSKDLAWPSFWAFCAVIVICITLGSIFGDHAHCIGYEKHAYDTADNVHNGGDREVRHYEDWDCVKWEGVKK